MFQITGGMRAEVGQEEEIWGHMRDPCVDENSLYLYCFNIYHLVMIFSIGF